MLPEFAPETTFFFDFDSTLFAGESLDLLLEQELAEQKDRTTLVEKIKAIQKLGMDGAIDLQTSLERRLQIVSLHRSAIEKFLRQGWALEVEVIQLIARLRAKNYTIFLLSNGFWEWIEPICSPLGLNKDNIIANRFEYKADGTIIGIKPHPIHLALGKWRVIAGLRMQKKVLGPVVMVGDSYADYQAKAPLGANLFIAWQMYIDRPKIHGIADGYVRSWSDWKP